jgi:hypothetical protein
MKPAAPRVETDPLHPLTGARTAMRVRHADLEAEEFESPKGNFGIAYREHVSCEDTG